ncbi:ABC transporter substrate-binding protein [Tepidibacter formicigenes]|jgi:peptide/nickel transport system substrate-binding protein|uniref:Peptide/nickel transport system substrate-binding protein n=1 Tax=Tepidibacter formicigenes DSM 15518 TaxID=1123349 RepID=A0A1M6M303_9FIRM|nr:ABC transporter substrate-binding protein [Tepidibacter formicigenes]SHJ77780.1 peptide/nickel transport system substrate-binding protein [Tepidibacter formicigenes DSM 15518]
MINVLKKFSIITFLVLIICLLTVGCDTKSIDTNSSNEDANKNLVIRLAGGDWGYPNPYKHYPRGPGGFKMELIFDSLLEKDEKGIIPWLAKDWKIENNGKEYIFTLRDNVKWHDGKKFNAEDVKFTFDYYKNHSPVWNSLLIDGKYIIENVEILNENEVKIYVNSSNATYLDRIGKMRIIPKHIWEKVDDPQKFNSNKSIIGCGPYKFISYNSEQGTYKLEAFKDYWGPKQKVSAIEWIPVSDPVLAFEKGEIDLISVSPDIISRYENNDEFKISKNKPFWGYRLIFNMNKRPELKDVNLRKAFAYGIDREEILQKVGRGSGIVASMGYIPKGHRWYNDKVEKYSLDSSKAKNFIKGKKYTFELLIGNSNKEVKMAELMKLTLQKVGININIKSVDMKTRDSLVKNYDFELAIIGHGGWGRDPDSLREFYASNTKGNKSPASGCIPGYYNEEINKLAKKQMYELNPQKRKEIIFKLQELISKEVPQIPVYNTIENFLYRPSKYNGWMYRYDHHYAEHCKLSYLERK